MFLDHFGLVEQPFGVTPDPRFLCLGPKHREALASLEYGTEADRGFLALIGRPGMGKTTLLYQFLDLQRSRARSAYVFQTDCTTRNLLRHILSDLGIASAGKDVPELRDALNEILLEEMRAGRRFILVIDEAQNLSEPALESIRLLSNFETPWKKLMQIVLAGQPQLAKLLAQPSLTQLRQRISSVVRLEPFTLEETQQYMNHRLWVAGYQGPELFSLGAQLAIAGTSEGIPRNINTICFNAMSLAFSRGLRRIDSKIVRESFADAEIGSLVHGSHSARSVPSPETSSATLQPGDPTPECKIESEDEIHSAAKASLRVKSWRWLPLSLTATAVLFFAFFAVRSSLLGRRAPALEILPVMESPAARIKIADPEVSRTVPTATADANILRSSHNRPLSKVPGGFLVPPTRGQSSDAQGPVAREVQP